MDTHVHINEPGRTEWEGFSTATRAAAAGGVTTLIEMPLNSIPATTTAAALREKLAAAAGKLWVDVGFWGGMVPGNSDELQPLWDAGVFGFKCFLVPSGVDEFAHVTEVDLRAGAAEAGGVGRTVAGARGIAWSRSRGPSRACRRLLRRESMLTWLAARPREAENDAVALLLRLGGEYGARIHIVHVSSADALAVLRSAKATGGAVTAETCPHYLTFAAEEIADGATEFKCAPPIRERENREKLWQGLGDGTIGFHRDGSFALSSGDETA